MYAQVEKPKENKSLAVTNQVVRKKGNEKQRFGFVDNRPETFIQRERKGIPNSFTSNLVFQRTPNASENKIIQRNGSDSESENLIEDKVGNCDIVSTSQTHVDKYKEWYNDIPLLKKYHDQAVALGELKGITVLENESVRIDNKTIHLDSEIEPGEQLNHILMELANATQGSDFDAILNFIPGTKDQHTPMSALGTEWVEWLNVLIITSEIMDSGKPDIQNSYLDNVKGTWSKFTGYLKTQIESGHTSQHYNSAIKKLDDVNYILEMYKEELVPHQLNFDSKSLKEEITRISAEGNPFALDLFCYEKMYIE
ncbi:hypothetical protein [Desulfoluna spongiiphila]|uniref:hypothetical protein n=1 Tax=Desulfoluna spongiiphila TaxID=419481 RepID=UPI001257A7CE|nr:hypothetical protein [Desulfoluna spongiiphila]VVS95102.1 hypothetical protein DBB_46790 [Desulfoluna spongiiphila]